MVVALYNGFPLAEGDTGAYIQQAIYPHFASDRTPFYGLFIRVTSLWTSLWFPVAAQCLLLSYLVLKYIKHFQNGVGVSLNYTGFSLTLLTVITIVSFTCVSWVTAYLMPDIFAGILLLAVLLYISDERGSLLSKGIYLVIIFFAIAMHNSHFLIIVLFSLILIIWSVIKNNRALAKRSATLLAVCVAVFTIMCSMNAAKKHGFVFSRGKDIFLMAKFCETGILARYLDENCDRKSYKICAFKNNLPTSLTDFLWAAESPLYKMGGWDSSKEEYSNIAHDILTTPRYAAMFAEKSVISTLKELTRVQAPGELSWQGKDTEPWKKVKQYFADELNEYSTSLQNTHTLNGGACNLAYSLFFILSTIWILLFYPTIMNKELSFIYGCILLFFIINACVTSTFSMVINRFQYRIFWILPATNAIIIIKYYTGKYQQSKVKSGVEN
jgi:hypothetical protein